MSIQSQTTSVNSKCSYSYFIFRAMLAFIYVPLLQRELDIFKDTIWNNHRGCKQRNKELPTGIPEHIYHFPEIYGGIKCGNLNWRKLDELRFEFSEPPRSIEVTVQSTANYVLTRDIFLLAIPTRS